MICEAFVAGADPHRNGPKKKPPSVGGSVFVLTRSTTAASCRRVGIPGREGTLLLIAAFKGFSRLRLLFCLAETGCKPDTHTHTKKEDCVTIKNDSRAKLAPLPRSAINQWLIPGISRYGVFCCWRVGCMSEYIKDEGTQRLEPVGLKCAMTGTLYCSAQP